MISALNGLHIAVFADAGFEPALLLTANHALQREGAITKVMASRRRPLDPIAADATVALPAPAEVEVGVGAGAGVDVDITTAEADAKDFDAALVIGGEHGAELDHVKLAAFLTDLRADGKPLGAIFKGVDLCINCGVVDGARIAANAAQAPAVRSAGGTPVDDAVVVDGTLVTARGVEDIDAFMVAAIEAIRLKFRAGADGATDLNAIGTAAS